MWMAFLFVASLLLSAAMMPKPNLENARPSKLGDFRFPRSKHGDPLPLVWGTVLQKSPIIAWYGDYTATPIREKVRVDPFNSKHQTIGHKNYMGIDCVLCLGPGVKLRKILADDKEVWSGNIAAGNLTINLPELFGGEKEGGGLSGDLTFYDGAINPAHDAYLITHLGANVPAYNGIARVLFKSFYIGTSNTPRAFSFEVSRITAGLHATYSVMPNGLDVNPMEVTYDAFVQNHGRLNIPVTALDLPSFIACATTLYNEGLGMSLLVQSAITGKDLLEEVMRVADGLLYQDPATSKIMAKLIREDYTAGTLPIFNESNILSLTNFQKTTWENTFNQCRVTFKDRANNYEDSVALTQDFANINFQNRVKSTDINVPGCHDAATAAILSARQMAMLNSPLYKCDIVSNRAAQDLRPGSVFVLSWGPYAITQMVMRVAKIDFGGLASNRIKISCVQDRFASGLVTFAAPEPTGWTPQVVTPLDVATRLLFTPPAYLSSAGSTETPATFDNAGRLYCVAVAPGGASISFDGMFSTNNFATDPTVALDDVPYNGSGLLLNAYASTVAAASRYDTGSTLVATGVAQSAISNLKQHTTLAQAQDGSALLMINNELFVYVGFVDNGGGQVTFPKIYRSILDTVPATHAINDRVWFINSGDGLLPDLLATSTVGYVKLLDQTTGGELPIGSATAFSATLSNRAGLPLQPQYLTLAGSRTPANGVGATSIAAAWKNRSRADTTLRAYDDAATNREADTQTRVQWRVGAGGYTTALTTGNSVALDVTGLTGTLEVIVDSQIISNSKYSTNNDTLTMELT
jgi:hypothetical protein